MQANVMTFYYIIMFYYISLRSSVHFITFLGVITDSRICNNIGHDRALKVQLY